MPNGSELKAEHEREIKLVLEKYGPSSWTFLLHEVGLGKRALSQHLKRLVDRGEVVRDVDSSRIPPAVRYKLVENDEIRRLARARNAPAYGRLAKVLRMEKVFACLSMARLIRGLETNARMADLIEWDNEAVSSANDLLLSSLLVSDKIDDSLLRHQTRKDSERTFALLQQKRREVYTRFPKFLAAKFANLELHVYHPSEDVLKQSVKDGLLTKDDLRFVRRTFRTEKPRRLRDS